MMLCILLNVNGHFGGTCRLHLQGQIKSQTELATCFMLVSCLAYSLALKMEVTCSSETLADFQLTTQHYIPEDGTRHKKCIWKIWSLQLKYGFLLL
jgi:hypothetical protein